MTFRPVAPGDAAFLAELAAARWSELPLPGLAELQDRAQRREYVDRWGSEGEHVVLADDTPIGRVWWADDDGRRIVDIVLLPSMQGRGIGSGVVAALVADAGDRTVRLSVEHTKAAWRRQLERLGFAETSSDGVFADLARPGGTQLPEV